MSWGNDYTVVNKQFENDTMSKENNAIVEKVLNYCFISISLPCIL